MCTNHAYKKYQVKTLGQAKYLIIFGKYFVHTEKHHASKKHFVISRKFYFSKTIVSINSC